MHRARTQNVDVLSDDTTVLSLSEHTLRRLTAEHPAVAAKLLENISRVLCERLAAAE
jgi:CRP-like cAMP-binding protein